MNAPNFLTSTCRYCRWYKPEGRRGGMCQMLGVSVQSKWQACTLALPAFAPSWDLERIMLLPEKAPVFSDARPLVSELDNCATELTEEMASFRPELKQTAPLLL